MGNRFRNLSDFEAKVLIRQFLDAGRFDEAARFISWSWIIDMRRRFGHDSILIPDVDNTIHSMTASTTTVPNLIDVFRLGYIKHRLTTTAERRPLLAVEELLHVREGKVDRAISESRRFGTDNDVLLVRTELEISGHAGDGSNREELNRLLSRCKADVVEMAAQRSCCVDPELAFCLIRTIPESEVVSDVRGVLRAGYSRGIYRMCAQLARNSSHHKLFEMCDRPLDRLLATAAIAGKILTESPEVAISRIEEAIDPAIDESGRVMSRALICRHVYRQLAWTAETHPIAKLKLLETALPREWLFTSCVSLLDRDIHQSPRVWARVADEVQCGFAHDVIRWRMYVMGLAPASDPSQLSHSALRDRMLAANTLSRVGSDDLTTVADLLENAKSASTYVFTLIKSITYLDARYKEAAIQLLAKAVPEIGQDVTWTNFSLLVEILRAIGRINGPLRNQVLRHCLDQLQAARPRDLSSDARLVLGKAVWDNPLAQFVLVPGADHNFLGTFRTQLLQSVTGCLSYLVGSQVAD